MRARPIRAGKRKSGSTAAISRIAASVFECAATDAERELEADEEA